MEEGSLNQVPGGRSEPDMVQDLRVRMRRGKTRSSRPIGLFMLLLSGAFFLLAFATGSLIAEVSSLTAFVLGALLLISSFEQRVTLFPSVEAIEGPVKTTVALLNEKGWAGKASFVPGPDGILMSFGSAYGSGDPIETPPYGHDLVEYYESQVGELSGKGIEFAMEWIPRALTDPSGLAESATTSLKKGEVTTKLVRPFVRPLCVKPFFSEKVCGTMGCPLVNSVGEALALSTKQEVSHVSCVYDPIAQAATAVHKISISDQLSQSGLSGSK